MSKVTVLGAAGGIGQPLSLLMKLNPRVTELALYDIKGGPGKKPPAFYAIDLELTSIQVLPPISAISTPKAQSPATTQHQAGSRKL